MRITRVTGIAALILASLAALAALPSPAAAQIKVQNLAGADFTPGQLKLPLIVHERSGVERKGVIVTGGVPFPPGFLPSVDKLVVVDKNNTPVFCQATPMVLWHKPAYDDSVQWALVSFAADVPANGTATYILCDNAGPGLSMPNRSRMSPLVVNKADKTITIATGKAGFVIPLEGQTLLASATIDGKNVLGQAGLRGTITAGEWADRDLKPGSVQATHHDAGGVTIEEQGPSRVVVCIKGGFLPGDKDKKFYDFTARLYFEANSPAVRIIYTISNSRLDPTLTGGARHAYVWPMTDASLVADLSLNGKPTAAAVVDGELISQALEGDGSFGVFQSALDSYKLTYGGKELASGSRHLGVLDASDGNAGVTVAKRYFREEWPSLLAASSKELRVGLLPGEAKDSFHLNLGQRKSWDIRLTLHGAKAPDQQAAFAEHDALLLFRPDPNWMVRAAGVTGSWTAGLAMTKAPAAKGGARRAEDIKQTKMGGIVNFTGGWERFGVISDWNAGGWHWNETTAFNDWVIHGVGQLFDESEIPTLWAADHCPMHFDNPNMAVFFAAVSGNTGYAKLKVETFPGYPDPNWTGSRERDNKDWRANPHQAPTGWPDTGHMGMWMWVEYYLLTGDARAREAICHLGQYARGHLWRWTHDDPKDGTNPGYPPGDFRKRNPEAEPDFKLDRRYVGWPLYCLSQFYQLTGDPAMLAEARIINGAFRNTARANPIGMLCRDCAGKNGEPAAEYSGNIIKKEKDGTFKITDGTCESQARECVRCASLFSSNFYSGIVIYGIREYYLASRDPDALDLLVGQADRFCQYTMIRDEAKRPLGWSYMFGDYWGPYTLEDSMSKGKPTPYMNSANELTSDAVARLYYVTGRADVLEAVEAAVAKNPINPRVWALHMAFMHRKVRQAGPAAIKDLAAEPLGGGKVKLTWAAPGLPSGDGEAGKAAFYQIKWTTAAKLVERVVGWPDRAEPLPTTPAEWLARANAFNARQRSFWASNNIATPAPKPQPAGTRESMVVESLPAGEVNLAIKSWDDAQNISDLSNVVTVTVK